MDISNGTILFCGSVDDGKSTLIGRFLFETDNIRKDILEEVTKASTHSINSSLECDLSLITDGLKAEREQGITIDLSYRYIKVADKRFTFIDSPGHVEFTKNMVAGVSHSDLAVILVDASKGISEQTKRHLLICSIFGIQKIIVAINKMDLVDWSRRVYKELKEQIDIYCQRFQFVDIHYVAMSALSGKGVVAASNIREFQNDRSFIETLMIQMSGRKNNYVDLRGVVQYIYKDGQKRVYASYLNSGVLREGMNILVLPSNNRVKVKEIYIGSKRVSYAFAGQSISFTLDDQKDVSRGSLICNLKNVPKLSNKIKCKLIWCSSSILEKKKNYLIKFMNKTSECIVEEINYVIDIKSLSRKSVKELRCNDVADIEICLKQREYLDTFKKQTGLGQFVLIDPVSLDTVAAAVIEDCYLSENISSRKARTFWFTGLSGSGKSTLSIKLHEELKKQGLVSVILDGDVIRKSLNNDLGFSREQRTENLRRIAQMAKIINDSGVNVICATISPYEKTRKMIQQILGDSFELIYLSTSFEECRKRDPKGLYAKAINGEIKNFTGVEDAYEKPHGNCLTLDTETKTIEECVQEILQKLIN